jgi:hypothetical protein
MFAPAFKRKQCKVKDSVAQLVEQYTFNVWVLGSSPSGITKSQTVDVWLFCFSFLMVLGSLEDAVEASSGKILARL